MCEFKSGIVLRDEAQKGGFKLLMSPWTEHHSDLISIHNLRDDSRLRFARVEFKPASMATADKPETYKLRIDEERTPEWFDDEMKEAVSDKMRAYIKSIIVTGDVCLLIGGQFILSAGAEVESAKGCVITAVLSGGTVQSVESGGTVQRVFSGGTVQRVEDGALINGEKKGTK